MIENLSEQSRTALEIAREEARRFQHEYVGTEHLLLGLIAEGAGIAATVLRSHGLDYAVIRHEVEQLVQPGPAPVSTEDLPLTPRASLAFQFAEEDARIVSQSLVDTEHLLFGLLREPEGVAGVVLRKCGLQLEELAAEIFKIRLLQMKIVERAVRPLRANMARKRRIRDELLGHLSAIYDEELARLNDPHAAVAAAGERFGSPAELTAELQASVPWIEQGEARLEPIFGWRAPESASRWMLRVGLQISLVMATACALAAILAVREFGWNPNVWLAIRPLIASMIVLPISVALSGICYFKIRDHLYGAFGSRRSWKYTIAWAGLLALVTVGCGLTFLAIAYEGFSPARAAFYPCIGAGIIWAAGAIVLAKIMGLPEIRDAVWALLDLDEQRLEA